MKPTLYSLFALLTLVAFPALARVRATRHSTPLPNGVQVYESRAISTAPPTIYPMHEEQRLPRIATNGDGALVLWRKGYGQFLYARLDSAGAMIDPTPSPLPTRVTQAWDVTWDGKDYVVFNGNLTRVRPDGSVGSVHEVDDAPTRQAKGASLISTGSGYLVLSAGSGGVAAVLFDSQGHTLRSTLLDATPSTSIPAAASNGTEVLAAWVTSTGLRTVRLAADGSTVAAGKEIAAVGPSSVDVTWSGSEWVVAWSGTGIGVQRIRADGTEGTRDSLAGSTVTSNISIAAIGTSWMAIWKTRNPRPEASVSTTYSLTGAQSGAAGGIATVTLDPLTEAFGRTQGVAYATAMAVLGGKLQTVWTHGPAYIAPQWNDILSAVIAPGETLSASLASARNVLLSKRGAGQGALSMASLNGHTLASWNEGMSLDGVPTKDLQYGAYAATVTGNGLDTYFLTAMYSKANIPWSVGITRFRSDGSPLDSSPIAVGLGTSPAAACGVAECLVSWNSDNNGTVAASRMSTSGTLLDQPPMSFGRSWADGPRVSWNGTSYLLVWSNSQLDSRGPIYAVRITGGIASPIQELGTGVYPAVASDGDGWLVAWAGRTLTLVHVGSDGTASAPQTAAIGGSWPRSYLAWNGRHYVVAGPITDGTLTRIAALRVGRDGVPLEVPFALNGEGDVIGCDTIVSSAYGRVTIGYTRMIASAPFLMTQREFLVDLEE
jgi:hypothetical protein